MPPRVAYAAEVTKLVAPGPSVARQTPGSPVRRPNVAAMKPAACSWRVATRRIFDFRRDSTKSRFSSPGMPKMKRIPSFSRHFTRMSVFFMGKL